MGLRSWQAKNLNRGIPGWLRHFSVGGMPKNYTNTSKYHLLWRLDIDETRSRTC